MKKLILIPLCVLLVAVSSCKKSGDKNSEVIVGDIKQVVETVNGITYKIFTDKNTTVFKGILVMGSANTMRND